MNEAKRNEESSAERVFNRVVMRLRALIGLLFWAAFIWLPVVQTIKEMPWHWIKENWFRYCRALPVLLDALITGNEQ